MLGSMGVPQKALGRRPGLSPSPHALAGPPGRRQEASGLLLLCPGEWWLQSGGPCHIASP